MKHCLLIRMSKFSAADVNILLRTLSLKQAVKLAMYYCEEHRNDFPAVHLTMFIQLFNKIQILFIQCINFKDPRKRKTRFESTTRN